MMTNRLLAVTVAMVCAAPGPLLAQSTVQIYGRINTDYEIVKSSGASPSVALPIGQLGAARTGTNLPSRDRLSSNSSNIGFKGSEQLGAGLKAIFQVESAIAFDNQATFGTNTAAGTAIGGGFATRNTRVGLSGDWGTLFGGQWNTPYKDLTAAVDPFYTTGIAYSGAIIGSPGFGVTSVTNGNITRNAAGTNFANPINASFTRRQGNSIQYWTPDIHGLSARLMYSAHEGKTSDSPSLDQIDPSIWGVNMVYEKGPLYLAYGYERHNDYFGLSAIAPSQAVTNAAASGSPAVSSHDTGNKIVARYAFGRTRLGLIFEHLEYEQSNSAAPLSNFRSYDRNAYALTATHEIGAGTLRALYGVARDGSCSLVGDGACLTNGLGARQYSLGYSYSLSKRTDLYGFYTRLANDSGANYQFAVNNIGASVGTTATGYLVGMRHGF